MWGAPTSIRMFPPITIPAWQMPQLRINSLPDDSGKGVGMRASTIALAAIPVLLGGLGLAVVAGGINPLDPFIPASEDVPARPDTGSGAESHESVTGTPIDGRRPHLSVIDGRLNLLLPAPLPAILSLLPGSAIDLAPLPSEPAGDDTPVPAPTGPRHAPATGAAPSPGNQTAHRTSQPSAPPVGGAPAAAPGWTPVVPATPSPATDPTPPRAIADPRFDGDVFTAIAGEIMNHVRPPQDGTQGPPPHAGQTGPPDHAGSPGRPQHAGGGAQMADDSHPGPR